MGKYMRMIMLVAAFSVFSVQPSHAGIYEIIKAAVVKVIKAVDLKIQRLQNKTIVLQNIQKAIENQLSKWKLNEISDWTKKQKEQYQKYYEELAKVKSIIYNYQRIREIMTKQAMLVDQYNRAWELLSQDDHFTEDELAYMERVYNGILTESLKNIEQIYLVVRSFSTEMSDAKRLELVNDASDRIDRNYDDLLLFNRQNSMLSLQRAKTSNEVARVKQLYGIR